MTVVVVVPVAGFDCGVVVDDVVVGRGSEVGSVDSGTHLRTRRAFAFIKNEHGVPHDNSPCTHGARKERYELLI